jgi:hypothetical protein
MAGKISWQIELQGLDAQITKLRTLDTLLNAISRKGGMLGGAGGINVGGSGGTTVVPGVPGGSSGINNSATVIAAAALGSRPNVNRYDAQGNSKPVQPPYVAPKNINTLDQRLASAMKRGDWGAVSDISHRFASHFGTGYPPMLKGKPTAASHLPYSSLYPEGNLPPGGIRGGLQAMRMVSGDIHSGLGITGRVIGNGLSTGAGAAVGAFGQAGKQVAGLFGSGPKSMMGILDKFFPQIIAITIAFEVLKKAVDLLINGIKKGAEMYQLAAKQATTVGKVSQLKSAFAAIGMGGAEEEAMTAMGQFNPNAKRTTMSGGQVIGAMRAAQFANIQQLTNMSKEFEAAMNDAASSARQMQLGAKANQEMSAGMVAISREWSTLLSQSATALQPFIQYVENTTEGFLKLANATLELYNRLQKFLHLIPSGEPGMTRVGGMGSKGANISAAWEKIGFQFGGNASNFAKETAHNTAATVQEIKGLSKTILILANVIGGPAGMGLNQLGNFALRMAP